MLYIFEARTRWCFRSSLSIETCLRYKVILDLKRKCENRCYSLEFRDTVVRLWKRERCTSRHRVYPYILKYIHILYIYILWISIFIIYVNKYICTYIQGVRKLIVQTLTVGITQNNDFFSRISHTFRDNES